ncbi:hypothetical protein AB833_02645 [Chromatiales bacterium (ex Bugula neritina AB1)]|nr:hypothetical protein AB833_02645 [Chromatiales bacterium (ex Bugula neritina AB1)]
MYEFNAFFGVDMFRLDKLFTLISVLVLNLFVVVSLSAQELKPNVVFIFLDDAAQDEINVEAVREYFPSIAKYLLDDGTYFENFHVVAPICGPSRASLFRGQYPHNTGVHYNEFGWDVFYNSGYTDDEIGMWMRKSGYHTALVGKYCHQGYPAASHDKSYVPPGWDDFRTFYGAKYLEFHGNHNGVRTFHGASPELHRTDVESEHAVSIVEEHDFNKPLFLYIAPIAPHIPVNSKFTSFAERYADKYSDAMLDRVPSLDEMDIGDKPAQFSMLPLLGANGLAKQDELFRDRLRSIKSVDDMVGDIVDALRKRGVLDSTYIFLTSDNGYLQGHHRLKAKRWPYDRVTRVPLLVRGPGVPAGGHNYDLLAHIDLAPTFLNLGGGEIPHFVDGQSFAGLVSNSREHIETVPSRSYVLISNDTYEVPDAAGLDARYKALRSNSELYVEWEDGGVEYYDLVSDPWQLESRYSLTGRRARALSTTLGAFSACQGASCRGSGETDQMQITLDVDQVNEKLVASGGISTNRPIEFVELVVRRVADRTYYDGMSFTPGYKSLQIAVDSDNFWSAEIEVLPMNDIEYWISARAINVMGRGSRIAGTAFMTPLFDKDDVIPELQVDLSSNDFVGSEFEVSGFVSDNIALEKLLLVVSRASDGFYWNGTAYQSEYVDIKLNEVVLGSNSVNWSYLLSDLELGAHFISTRVYDHAGNQNFHSVRIEVVKEHNDKNPPIHYSIYPADGAVLVDLPVIQGSVTDDDNNVVRVEVVVFELVSKKYWNGVTLQSHWTRLPVSIEGTSSDAEWAYRFDPKLPPGQYFVAIDAWDSLGNQSRRTARYTIDHPNDQVVPNIDVSVEVDGLNSMSKVRIVGHVEDSGGIRNVWVVIRRLDDNAYWNGLSMQSNWAATYVEDARGNSHSEFYLEWAEMPAGDYMLRVNASDISANLSFETAQFMVD